MYKKLLSETIIYGMGAILPRLIIFILTPFIIKEVNSVEYSQYGQLYAAVSYLNVILTFGFETAFFRYASQDGLYKKTLNTSFWFMFFTSSIFILLVYLFLQPLANFADYANHPEYLKWFGWIIFFDTLCVIPFAYLRFNSMPAKYALVRIVISTFQAILTFAMLYWIADNWLEKIGLSEKVSYTFVANLLASMLGFVLLLPVLRKIQFKFDWALFKKMFHYGYPIMIAGLAFVTNENLDKLIQRNVISEADAGAYNGVYKLAMILTLFVTAYRMGVEPFFFKVSEKADSRKTYADVLLYFSIVCNVVIIGVVANLGWIKLILIRNPSYWIAMDIVPIILIANLFYGLYFNLSTWYKVTDKTYVGTIISLVGCGITVVMNFFLLRKYGFMVSAWATLLAYASMMLISYFWGQKEYKIPYKTKKIVLYTGSAIAITCVTYYLLDSNFFIGNGLLIMYIAMTYFIEKRSIKLEKK